MNTSPATIKSRLIALMIDFFIIILYALCLFGCSLLFYQLVFNGVPDTLGNLGRGESQLLGFTTLTLPIGLYFFLAESGHYSASFGKRIAKLEVVTGSGNTPSKKQIALRTATKLLPWEFAHTFVWQIVYYSRNGDTPPLWVMAGLILANILPMIYIGTVIIRKDHRGPHDLVANTLVVPLK